MNEPEKKGDAVNIANQTNESIELIPRHASSSRAELPKGKLEAGYVIRYFLRLYRKFDFTLHELLVLIYCLEATYAAGREDSAIDNDKEFALQCSLDKSSFSRACDSLVSIKQVLKRRRGGRFSLRPHTKWKVDTRFSGQKLTDQEEAEAILRKAKWVQLEAFDLEQIDNDAGFEDSMTESLAHAASVDDSSTTQPDVRVSPVDESSTSGFDKIRAAIDNQPDAGAVDESSTGINASNAHHCKSSTALSSNALAGRRTTPLNKKEQALMDEVKTECGDSMGQYWRFWHARVRSDPDLTRILLDDLKIRKSSSHLEPVVNPSAWMKKRYYEKIKGH